jgi:hypothetical protein
VLARAASLDTSRTLTATVHPPILARVALDGKKVADNVAVLLCKL